METMPEKGYSWPTNTSVCVFVEFRNSGHILGLIRAAVGEKSTEQRPIHHYITQGLRERMTASALFRERQQSCTCSDALFLHSSVQGIHGDVVAFIQYSI